MTLSLEQLSARMRQGEDIPLSDTARIALALSIPSILEQLVVTAMEYIDAAMVGHIGAKATAAIGIVSSSTWLLHGILVGLYTAFSIQIAQYLGADRQQDARGVLRQSMLFNLILGLGAAAFGVGISRFLPGWLGADISLQASSSAYFAIWSAALPFTMAMGMYAAMLRATGDALTPSLISVLVCALDVVFNFFLINPTRQILLFGQSVTVWGAGLEVPGAALARRFPRPSAVCWRWASCCCGTARFASESPAAGASPPPACATSGGWVHRWPLSVRPSRRHRCCSSVSSRASARWPSRPTASASAPRASATWQATAFRTLHRLIGQAVAPTAGTWRSGSPGSARQWA